MEDFGNITGEEITKQYIDKFYNSLVKSIDKNIYNRIKKPLYDSIVWYINHYNLNQEIFGYEILSYLVLLCELNIIDRYEVESLSKVANITSGYKMANTHFIFNFPKEAHDYDIEYYYKEMDLWLMNLNAMGISYDNPKFQAIFMHHKYREHPKDSDWVKYMTIYLYQSDKYNEDDYYDIYGSIDNDKEGYKEFLILNGMNEKLEKTKIEIILESYINMKLGYQKRIK